MSNPLTNNSLNLILKFFFEHAEDIVEQKKQTVSSARVDFQKEVESFASSIFMTPVKLSPINQASKKQRAFTFSKKVNTQPINEQLLIPYLVTLSPLLDKKANEYEVIEHPQTELLLPEKQESIILCSPSIRLLEELRSSRVSLHNLHWRQLEELVAELLIQDGYSVELGPGTKDNGVDIIAMKKDPTIGFFLTVWQAKKLNTGNKVDLHIIRELADTRVQHNATKGIIVTTTSLTKGALARIEQDRYLLGKVDGNDLSSWIRKEK